MLFTQRLMISCTLVGMVVMLMDTAIYAYCKKMAPQSS